MGYVSVFLRVEIHRWNFIHPASWRFFPFLGRTTLGFWSAFGRCSLRHGFSRRFGPSHWFGSLPLAQKGWQNKAGYDEMNGGRTWIHMTYMDPYGFCWYKMLVLYCCSDAPIQFSLQLNFSVPLENVWGCGMGPKSQEFLDLLLVPLAASVIPLRKSLERLNQRFGERQVVTLLQNKASRSGWAWAGSPYFLLEANF